MRSEQGIFYVYVDWTEEEVPRSFYVGKGRAVRLRIDRRNNRWGGIKNKYGWKREIILGTLEEEFAVEMEINLIRAYKTFESQWADKSGWGANFTAGGEGPSGRKVSDATKLKMNQSRNALLYSDEENFASVLKAKQILEIRKLFSETELTQKQIGEKYGVSRECIGSIVRGECWKDLLTEEEKQALASKEKGVSEQTRKKLSRANTGKVLCQNGKDKIGAANSKRIWKQESKDKLSTTSSGENSGMSVLKNEQVIEIRQKYSTGDFTHAGLAVIYGVDKGTISKIVLEKTWRHLLPKKQEGK